MSTTYHTCNQSDMAPHHTYCGNFAVGYASYSQQRKSLGTKEPQETSMQQWTHSKSVRKSSDLKFRNKTYLQTQILRPTVSTRSQTNVISSRSSSTVEFLDFPEAQWLAQFLRLGYSVGVYSQVWDNSQLPLDHMWQKLLTSLVGLLLWH